MGKGGDNQFAEKSERKITLEELSKHRLPQDAWLAYKGRVYDVSNWEDHPGGSVIFTHAGDDCTDVFTLFHTLNASKYLKTFEIGVLDETVKPSPESRIIVKTKAQREFEQAYRDLYQQMVAKGLFQPSYLFYFYKVSSTFLLACLSTYMVRAYTSFGMHMVAACIMGLFWQQCGWLSHDFLHHQVFKRRAYGDMMGLLIGNYFQAFSVQWWKSKHNAHHAVPNLHASVAGACDGDPDIDTMPYLAWSTQVAHQGVRQHPWAKFMVKYQQYLYFPLLTLARFSWVHQSWVFNFGGWGQHSVAAVHIDQKHASYPMAEKVLLICHYLTLLWIMSPMSVGHAVAYFLVAQMSCSLMLAIVFGLGHNGMAVYPADQRPDYWKLQVTTTRNVNGGPGLYGNFIEWFCGGLDFQVDHHLFPMMPRHNLKEAHKYVVKFCKEQGVTYHETGVWDGTIEVLKHLKEISVEFFNECPMG